MSTKYSRNWRFINSPLDLPNLVQWQRFNTGITVTGDGVSQWDDQSGNGHHLLQGTDTNRPSKEADGSILFDGVDNFLQTDSFTLVQPVTIYFLGKQITYGVLEIIYDGVGSPVSALNQNFSSPDIALSAGATLLTTVDFTLDTYNVVTAVFNSTASVLQIGSNSPAEGNAGTNDFAGLTLGISGTGSGASHIQAKEFVIFDITAHTAKQITQMTTYLNRVGGGIF